MASVFPRVDHITLNVIDFAKSKEFYTELLVHHLGGKVEIEDEELFGVGFGNGLRIFFLFEIRPQGSEHKNSTFDKYKVGLHHFALELENKSEIDKIYQKLLDLDVKILDAPTYYPEYADGYYAVFWEDLNGFKMEFLCYDK